VLAAEINARLDAVEELSQRSVWREELTGLLKEVGDIERLCGRLSLGAGNARDLRALALSLAQLPRLGAVLSRCETVLLHSLAGPLGALPELAQLLQEAVVDEPPVNLKEGGFIRPGFHAELDTLVALSTSGKDVLLRIEARERERTGIGSLKVRYNKVFGYYLEVTKANLHLVPQDYIRKQTTVGAERFVTPELKEYEEQVLTAEERRCALELELFEQLRAKVVAEAPRLRSAAEAVATSDALLSLARCAAEYGYVRPVVDDSDVLSITAGRHPVVERVLGAGESFVPNDVRMDASEAQILVITGPNMAGKSTVMRQVALTVLMAQAGSFVPAAAARVGLCDRIFTRVGAADNLARGQSTFMVEMTETSHILHHATKRSLVVLDEIGRGTSTYDGLSIAWAVAEHLHDKLGARTLFATHYHELVDLAREKPRVKNLCIAVKEHGGKVLFLRKLVPGGANRSYGIEWRSWPACLPRW
jgi:DNA mismatch repair protein MutS